MSSTALKEKDRNDRRVGRRLATSIEAEVNWSVKNHLHKEKVEIINASNTGLMLTLDSPVGLGFPLTLEFCLPASRNSIQLSGSVIWSRPTEDKTKTYAGVHLNDVITDNNDLNKLILGLSHLSTTSDRRNNQSNSNIYAVKNRATDYSIEFLASPYHSFLDSLIQVSNSSEFKNIVISDGLLYLQKKIRDIFPLPRIIPSSSLHETLGGDTLVIVNLDCRRKHESFTFLDFEEHLLKSKGRQDPLKTLVNVSRALKPNSRLTFVSLGPILEQKRTSKYLTVSKFQKIEFLNSHIVNAEKRPLFEAIFGKGKYLLREVESRQEIDSIQHFAAQLFGDMNFIKEIDDLFTDHSDFYMIIDCATNRMINFARVTINLPNHFLPCMLAHKKGASLHLQLQDPDNLSYGEFLAPYLKSLSMTRTYSELVKRFVDYGERGVLDVAFTTYLATQKRDFDFLSHYLGFIDPNCTLGYGTFSGDWNLIYTTRKAFHENIKLKFHSATPSTRLINSFLE